MEGFAVGGTGLQVDPLLLTSKFTFLLLSNGRKAEKEAIANL